MKELITVAQAEAVLKVIAIAAPIAGLVIGTLVGWARRRMLSGMVLGLTVGLAGTVVFGLWRMHIWLGEAHGFASVKYLSIQLVVFTALGIAVGYAAQRTASRPCSPEHRAERSDARDARSRTVSGPEDES